MAIAVLTELVLCDESKPSYMHDGHLAFVEVCWAVSLTVVVSSCICLCFIDE